VAELAALKKMVEKAKTELVRAMNEAEVRKTYTEAMAPYREVYRKAGVEYEYARQRAANVCEEVVFHQEKVDNGLEVVIKGRPETEEIIPAAALAAK
jgi:hypothetical protein